MQYSGNFLLLLLAYLHYDFSNHVSVTKERKVPRHLLLPSNTYSHISFLPQLYRVSGNLASYLRVFVAPTLSANVSCIGYSKVHFHLFLSLAVFSFMYSVLGNRNVIQSTKIISPRRKNTSNKEKCKQYTEIM